MLHSFRFFVNFLVCVLVLAIAACSTATPKGKAGYSILKSKIGGSEATLLLQQQSMDGFVSYHGRLFAADLADYPMRVSGTTDSLGQLVLDINTNESYESGSTQLLGILDAKTGFIGKLKRKSGQSETCNFSIEPLKGFTQLDFADSLIVDKKHGIENPKSNLSYSTLLPTPVDAQLEKVLLLEQFNDSLAKNAEMAYQTLRNNWFAEFKAGIVDDTSAYGYSFHFEQQGYMSIEYNDNRFISFNSNYYAYEGGAHGNYGSSIFTYDKTNKKRLQLSDLVINGTSNVDLNKAITARFREMYHVKPEEDLQLYLFENQIEANTNVAILGCGLLFLYNPYEIAAYSVGQIEVWVPFSEIRNILVAPYNGICK